MKKLHRADVNRAIDVKDAFESGFLAGYEAAKKQAIAELIELQNGWKDGYGSKMLGVAYNLVAAMQPPKEEHHG